MEERVEPEGEKGKRDKGPLAREAGKRREDCARER